MSHAWSHGQRNAICAMPRGGPGEEQIFIDILPRGVPTLADGGSMNRNGPAREIRNVT